MLRESVMANRVGNYIKQHHLALLCLFLVLGSGTAWALERNSVRSKHIENGQVRSADLNGKAQAQWALVRDDGSIVDQSGGISVDGENEGAYVIDFGRRISGRALMATPTYEGSPDIATAHVSPCGDDGDALKAGCDYLVDGADASGRHAYVFTQTTSGSGGDAAGFYIAALP